MAGFNFGVVDPIFEALMEEHRDTLTAIARAQAERLVPAIQTTTLQSLKLSDDEMTKIAEKLKPELTEEEFNQALVGTQPSVLEAIFTVGFTQGFCMKHRLSALDNMLYTLTDGDSIVDEESGELSEETASKESQEGNARDGGTEQQ